MEVQQQTSSLSNILDDPSAHQDANCWPSPRPPPLPTLPLVHRCVSVCLSRRLASLGSAAGSPDVGMRPSWPDFQSCHVICTVKLLLLLFQQPWPGGCKTPQGFFTGWSGVAGQRFLSKTSPALSLTTAYYFNRLNINCKLWLCKNEVRMFVARFRPSTQPVSAHKRTVSLKTVFCSLFTMMREFIIKWFKNHQYTSFMWFLMSLLDFIMIILNLIVIVVRVT